MGMGGTPPDLDKKLSLDDLLDVSHSWERPYMLSGLRVARADVRFHLPIRTLDTQFRRPVTFRCDVCMTGPRENLTVLFVSNVLPGDPGGRAEKLDFRRDRLAENGIELVIGYIPRPYWRSFLLGLISCSLLARRVEADLVTSISNPMHLHFIGYVASQVARVPWVAELVDPIAVGPDRDPDAVSTKIARAIERLTVTRATRVLWGDGIQIPDDYFERSYGVTEGVTKVPTPGFNADAFESADAIEYDEFTMTYAGSFYEGWSEPYEFIEGVRRHVESVGASDLRVQFYGDWNETYEAAVAAAGIDDIVEHHSFVPHDAIIPVLKGSDFLIYVGGDDPSNRLNVPSKIWDYVGARTPILAIVDPNFRVAELVESLGLGFVVAPSDVEGIAEAIATVRSNAYSYDPDPAVFEHTHKKKFDRIAEIYRDVASR